MRLRRRPEEPLSISYRCVRCGEITQNKYKGAQRLLLCNLCIDEVVKGEEF